MIRIVTSAFSTARLEAARRFISSFPPATEMLLIGASREAIDDLVWRLSASMKATFGLHRFSFTQLAARIAMADFARTGLAQSTSLGTEAAAARATFEALRRRALSYFGPIARHPGFARALAATLAELRLCGINPSSIV